eukprot:1769142-Pyramimonas_sp.AAC.1
MGEGRPRPPAGVHRSCRTWPRLFCLRDGRGGGFERLDIDMAKMGEAMGYLAGSMYSGAASR